MKNKSIMYQLLKVIISFRVMFYLHLKTQIQTSNFRIETIHLEAYSPVHSIPLLTFVKPSDLSLESLISYPVQHYDLKVRNLHMSKSSFY